MKKTQISEEDSASASAQFLNSTPCDFLDACMYSIGFPDEQIWKEKISLEPGKEELTFLNGKYQYPSNFVWLFKKGVIFTKIKTGLVNKLLDQGSNYSNCDQTHIRIE